MKWNITPVCDNILRVVCGEEDAAYCPGAQLIREEAEKCAETSAVAAEEENGSIRFFLDGACFLEQKDCLMTPKEVYRFTFTGSAPEIITEKTIDGERSFVKNAETIKVADAYEAKLTFALSEDEAIYGLGQHENGYYNYRDVKEYLYQNNMKIPMPVMLSSKNYAILFDAECMFVYEEKDGILTLDFDAVDQMAYYLITGKNFDELIDGVRTLTGKAVMLPKWAFGYIQSKERYKTQEEILAVTEEFEKREIPLSCIVLDWHSWEKNKWGNKIFDKSRFHDARAMVDALHEKGVHFMISVWPNMNNGTENNAEMAKAGKLLCNNSTYDAFDPEARELYWKQCERELFAAGTDAWWCDSTEPFTPDWNGATKLADDVRYQMAKDSTNKYLDARVSNSFALAHARGIYENQRAACSEKRVVNLTRSGSAGSQRYGTILWSGDIAATWEVLRNQIAEGLSMCMSGIPYWTLDAGAFFTGTLECWRRFIDNPEAQGPQPWFWHGLFEKGVEDPGYREIYVRWLELAAFLPIMRSHGTDTPREPWNFGEPGSVHYDAIVKYIKKRCRMLPYSYSLAGKVYHENYTIMRSLMFDFPQDENVRTMGDEYMYGPAYLVCPVTRPMDFGAEGAVLDGNHEVEVYLPDACGWYDEETGAYYGGGQSVKVDAPVDKMPVFIRAGAVIPQSADQNLNPDEIHVYAGEDGRFTLYLDNGQDYAYENGEYSRVSLIWKDAEKCLELSLMENGYGHPEAFTVVLHTPEGMITKEISWDGSPAMVKFD